MTSVSTKFSAALTALLLGLLPASVLHAADRQAGSYSTTLVQTPDNSDDLGRYLSRLARDPRDVESLIGAGEAALKLNDPRAATEFFARADAVNPNNKRVKTGLARAMLGMENPTEALRLFREAVRLGARDVEIAGDRGLALDLTGDPVSAQRDYKLALDRDANDPEVLRRYAVSLGISGKWQEADRVIDPLLRKSDKTAWRNRAFVLAMNGQSKQARDITQVMMPKNMAAAIQPFMDRMPTLTPAQRAAAVHFGHFPSGMVRSSQPAMVQPVPSAATSRPSAQLKNRAKGSEMRTGPTTSAAPAQVAAAAPVPRQVQPVPPARPSAVQIPPPRTRQTPVQPAPVLSRPAPLSAQTVPSPRTEDRIGPPAEPNGISSAAPAPVASPPPEQRSLAEIMRGVSVPDAERTPATAPVDLTEIARIQAEKRKAQQAAAAKAKADAEAKAKAKADAEAKAKAKAEAALKAKNPARIWVQIATGRDAGALAFDMAKLRKKYPDLLKGKDAWISPWGATRRMVIGPFTSTSVAKNFFSDWLKAGGDGYVWQSTEGLEVEKLVEK